MVYLAGYEGIDGTSPSDLVAAVDPALDREAAAPARPSRVELTGGFPATFETMIAAPDGDPANEAFAAALSAIETQGD